MPPTARFRMRWKCWSYSAGGSPPSENHWLEVSLPNGPPSRSQVMRSAHHSMAQTWNAETKDSTGFACTCPAVRCLLRDHCPPKCRVPKATDGSEPRNSMMSISPDAAQVPWQSWVGNFQMAGQRPFPAGSLARTSMRPNLQSPRCLCGLGRMSIAGWCRRPSCCPHGLR